MSDWRDDHGEPAYDLPMVVDTPAGPKDISDWASRQVRFRYWLALCSGQAEWNARMFVPRRILLTLEHGKTYTCEQLEISKRWQRTAMTLPDTLRFKVERL